MRGRALGLLKAQIKDYRVHYTNRAHDNSELIEALKGLETTEETPTDEEKQHAVGYKGVFADGENRNAPPFYCGCCQWKKIKTYQKLDITSIVTIYN